MPQLIAAILIIVLIIAVIAFLVVLMLFISVNLLATADKFLGSWTFVPPYVSWALNGFFIGSLSFFAVREAPKLNRPDIQPFIIGGFFLLIIITPLIGPMIIGPTIAHKNANNAPTNLAIVTVLKNVVNIRENPSMNAKIIAKSYRGERLDVLESQGDWYRVKFRSGIKQEKVGWINKTVVLFSSDKSIEWLASRVRTSSSVDIPIQKSANILKPLVPYEDHGACPFECCTYHEWIAKEDVDILADRINNSPVAFKVHRGEKIIGETGLVITTKLGNGKLISSAANKDVQIPKDEIVKSFAEAQDEMVGFIANTSYTKFLQSKFYIYW
jgi:hypothetical protein